MSLDCRLECCSGLRSKCRSSVAQSVARIFAGIFVLLVYIFRSFRPVFLFNHNHFFFCDSSNFADFIGSFNWEFQPISTLFANVSLILVAGCSQVG